MRVTLVWNSLVLNNWTDEEVIVDRNRGGNEVQDSVIVQEMEKLNV